MKSQFETIIASESGAFLESFGETVFVKGVKLTAIFEENAFEDGSGETLINTMTFQRDDMKYIAESDNIVMNNRAFQIRRIPRDTEFDSLVTLEVRHV